MPEQRRSRRRRQRPHLDPAAAARLILPEEPADAGTRRGRERFEAAAAIGPVAGGRPEDRDALTALAGAEIVRIGEVLYGSNAVFLIELDAPDPAAGGQPMRAVYKPARGERPLWDFPRHTLYLREVATYLVDAALGMGHVPPTTLRDGPLGPGSVQLFVHTAEQRPTAEQAEAIEAQLRGVAALDVLVNNADRKRTHLMIGSDLRVRAIDNALTFLPYPRQRTALISLGGSALPAPTAERVSALAGAPRRSRRLREALLRLLAVTEVDAFMHRLEELASEPYYPELDDWDGRPFEWW